MTTDQRCRGCRWWDGSGSEWSRCLHEKLCDRYEVYDDSLMPFDGDGVWTARNFGCVHWEKREDADGNP